MLEFTNAALVQDEVLISIETVLDADWPVGPAFLHSLSSLTEAVVLHEHIYYDALRQVGQEEGRRPNSVPAYLERSTFVQQLHAGGALRLMPEHSDLDTFFKSQGVEYDTTDFIMDALYDTSSFAYAEPTAEQRRFDLYFDILSKAPSLLEAVDLLPEIPLDDEEEKQFRHVTANTLTVARELRLSKGDIQTLEALNRRARGYCDLARHTGLHLQPFILGVPHHAASAKLNESMAHAVVTKVDSKAIELDKKSLKTPPSSRSPFHRVTMPLLTQKLIQNCKGSKNALASELLELRYKHRNLRATISSFEKNWNVAATRSERWRLDREFNSSLNKILDREERMGTRIIYWLWDVLSEPTKISKKIGDKLVQRGSEEYLIGKAYGLYDLWKDLRDTSPAEQLPRVITQIFPRQASDITWAQGEQFSEALEHYMHPEDRE